MSDPKTNPPSTPFEPTVVTISKEEAQVLAREGLELRREVQARYAKMKQITEDELKLRAR